MKKGFTLIELLAVIVILAIIALIAVPIVINIINDSKKESLQRSIELYVDYAQKAITKHQMTHPGFNPKECTIEDKKLTCDGTEIEVEMKGQTPESGTITFNSNNKLYYDVELEGMEYILNSEGKQPPQPAPAKATGEDYRGYYADVDGDGNPDGIIYADLGANITYPQSGDWYNEKNNWGQGNGTYSYAKETNLNEYTVSSNTYKKNDGFGENKIIKLKKNKNKPRFYIMALEDFTTGSFEEGNSQGYSEGTYFWYNNAYGKMSTYADDTKTDFGKGYANTGKIIEIWNKNGEGTGSYTGATQDDHDIWKHIQGEYVKGWYIPSRGEWAAFGDYFKKRTENKLTHNYESGSYVANSGNYNSTFGLSSWYWSSSQFTADIAWNAYFGTGYLFYYNVYSNFFVRLGATF